MNEFCRTISKRLVLTLMALTCSLIVVAQNVTVSPTFSANYVEDADAPGRYVSVVGTEIRYNISVPAGYTVKNAVITVSYSPEEDGSNAEVLLNSTSVNIPVVTNTARQGLYILEGTVTLRRVENGVERLYPVSLHNEIIILDPQISLLNENYEVLSDEEFEIDFQSDYIDEGSMDYGWQVEWTTPEFACIEYINDEVEDTYIRYRSHCVNEGAEAINAVYSAKCDFYLFGTLLHTETREVNVTVYPRPVFEHTTSDTFNIDRNRTLEMGFAISGGYPGEWTYRWKKNGDNMSPLYNGNSGTERFNVNVPGNLIDIRQLSDWKSDSTSNITTTATKTYTFSFAAGAELTFDWLVNGGNLVITLDGAEIVNRTGFNRSATYSKTFDTAGSHTLEVRHTRQSGPDENSHYAEINNVVINGTLQFADWTSTNHNDSSFTQETYTFDVVAGSNLDFDWSVSSESGYDFLIVTLDGTEILEESGTKSGHYSKTFSTAGSHTLVVKYTKDGSQNHNSDQGRVYNITVDNMNQQLGNWTSVNADEQVTTSYKEYVLYVAGYAELAFDWNVTGGDFVITLGDEQLVNVTGRDSGSCNHIFANAGTDTLRVEHTEYDSANNNHYGEISNASLNASKRRLDDWSSNEAGNHGLMSTKTYTFTVSAGAELEFDWAVFNGGHLSATIGGNKILDESGENTGHYNHHFDIAGTYTLEVEFMGDGSCDITNFVIKSPLPNQTFADWTSTNRHQPNTTSQETYTFDVVAGGKLDFDWSVSSEKGTNSYYDYLLVTLDGTEILKKHGVDSGNYSKTFDTAGTHTLVVEYIKDGSVNDDVDQGRVYNIVVENPNQQLDDWTSENAGNQIGVSFDTYTIDVDAGAELSFDWAVNGGNLIVSLDGAEVVNKTGYETGSYNHTFDAAGAYTLEVRYNGEGYGQVNNIVFDTYYKTLVYSVVAENTYDGRTTTLNGDFFVNIYPRTSIAINGDSIFNFADEREIQLGVETAGGRIGAWQYEWYRNNELVNVVAENVYPFHETPGERFAMNSYRVVARNIAENGDTIISWEKEFTSSVYPVPVLEFVSDSIFNFLGCDSVISLEYAKKGGYYDGWTYEWRKNGVQIAGDESEESDTVISAPESERIYFIYQPHHSLGKTSWAVAEGSDILKSNVALGIECDPYDVRQQFKFIVNENGRYLYSVGEQKYVNKDCSLSDVPTDTIGFVRGDYENTLFFNFGGIYNVNVNGNRDLVIDSWTTPDGGNSCELLDIEGVNAYTIDSLDVTLAETETAVEDVYELIATNTFKDGTEWFCDTITFNVNTYPQTRIVYLTDPEFNFAQEREIELGVEAAGGCDDGWAFRWTKNGVDVEATTFGAVSRYFGSEHPTDSLMRNEYKVIATNSAANGDVLKVYEMDFDVNVYPLPLFREVGNHHQQTVGGIAFERSVEVDGGYADGWQLIWRRNGQIIGTNEATCEFVEDNRTGSEVNEVLYSVQAINNFADGTEWYNETIAFPVRVYPEITYDYVAMPNNVYELYNETLDLGANFYGGVAESDNGSWTFEWRKNGGRLYNATGQVYTHNAAVNNSTSIDNASYTLVAKHWIDGDEVWSNTSEYIVKSYPLARCYYVTGSDTTICGGNELTFAMDIRCADADGWTFEWRRDGVRLPETTSSLTVFEENNSETVSREHTYVLTATNRHNGDVWFRQNYEFNSTIRPKLIIPEALEYETMLREGDIIELGVAAGRGGDPTGWRYTWYNSHDGSSIISGQTGAALDEYVDVENYGHQHKEMRTENYMLCIENVDENSNTPVHYADTMYFQVTVHRCPLKPFKLRRKGNGTSRIFIADMKETTGLQDNQLEDNDYSFAFGYGNSEIVRDDYSLRYQMYTQSQASNNPWVYTYWEYEDGYVCKSDKVYLSSRAASDEIEEDVITVEYDGFKASLLEPMQANVRVYSYDGALVKQMSYDEQAEFDENFDLIDLDGGFYLIEVCIGDNREVKKIFIKE